MNKKQSQPTHEQAEREKRLGQALRDNLRKRKQREVTDRENLTAKKEIGFEWISRDPIEQVY